MDTPMEKQEIKNSGDLIPLEYPTNLSAESLEIINQLVCETDKAKSNDLTELFNQNQKKKTMIRLNKLGDLLDIVTDQTIDRFMTRPDEISNQELIQVLKTAQDAVERNQKLLQNTPVNQPLIQINQQTNELNVGEGTNLTKESRDKIKNAVSSILAGLTQTPKEPTDTEIIIENGELKND